MPETAEANSSVCVSGTACLMQTLMCDARFMAALQPYLVALSLAYIEDTIHETDSLRELTRLTALTLCSTFDTSLLMTEEATSALKVLSSLQVLTLSSGEAAEEHAPVSESLIVQLEHLPRLTALDLTGSYGRCLASLTSLKLLKSLSLVNAERVWWQPFPSEMGGLTSLTHLLLSSLEFEGSVRPLALLTGLQELFLTCLTGAGNDHAGSGCRPWQVAHCKMGRRLC